MEIQLGKISYVSFGIGGYQDAQLGIHFSFDMKGSGVGDSRSYWDSEIISHTENCKWTEQDRTESYAEIMRFVSKLLNQAKVKSVDQLKGIPVEITFDNRMLKSWRILKEVI